MDETMSLDKFLVNSDMLCIKKFVFKLGNSMMTPRQLFQQNEKQTKPKYSKNRGFGQIYSQQSHVCYQKTCTQAWKLNGDLEAII